MLSQKKAPGKEAFKIVCFLTGVRDVSFSIFLCSCKSFCSFIFNYLFSFIQLLGFAYSITSFCFQGFFSSVSFVHAEIFIFFLNSRSCCLHESCCPKSQRLSFKCLSKPRLHLQGLCFLMEVFLVFLASFIFFWIKKCSHMFFLSMLCTTR